MVCPGTINVFLTEGYLNHTDYERESFTRCGVFIHTHQSYGVTRSSGFIEPSRSDVLHSIYEITDAPFGEGRVPFPKKRKYAHNYMFDGKALWSYKANPVLYNLWKTGNRTRHNLIQRRIYDKYYEYEDEFRQGDSLKTFLQKVRDLGVDIDADVFWRKPHVLIKDSLECDYERRDQHLVLPESQLLNQEDLRDLFNRALDIMEKRKKSLESPFG